MKNEEEPPKLIEESKKRSYALKVMNKKRLKQPLTQQVMEEVRIH